MSGTLFDLGHGREKHRGRKPDEADLDPGLPRFMTRDDKGNEIPVLPWAYRPGVRPPTAEERLALARTTDPFPSHAAAESIVPSLDGLRREAVDAVTRWPGRTATELSRLAGQADPRRLNRRLGECERMGMVIRGEERRCSVTGRTAATWVPR